LKDQLTELETFTEPDEVEMGNFKRMATREALYLLLNGMHAFASKTDIISTFGKYITDELPVAPIQVGDERPSYNGAEKTRTIEQDAKNALHHWNPDKRKIRRTLTSHHGRNPLTMSLKVNKQLPPKPKTLKSRLRKEKENEDKDEEQQEEKDEETENEVEDLDIDQGEEQQQEKPVSSRTTSLDQHSLYKPDEVDNIDQDSQIIPDSQSNISLPHATPSIYHPSPMVGGFSNVHLNEGLTNQQNLYQFYQQYIPPRAYEEMVGPAVFRGAMENKHDAGGFVLPFANPNFGPSPSNSSDRRLAPSPTSSSDRRSVSSRGELDRNDTHQ
jgi:hypothetical protein